MRAGLPRLRPLAVGALFIAAGMFGAPDPVFAEDDIDKGRKLVNRLCAGCHMVPGQGEKQGENDIPGFVAVSKRPNQSRHEIVTWLRSIPPMMPNHRLTQDEMYAVAAYIMTLGARGGDSLKR